MTSEKMRSSSLFMRNNYDMVGKWDIPLIKKQKLDTDKIQLIACSDTRTNDLEENKKCGVHFFVDDYRFNGIYDHPQRTLKRYSQYAFLLTPDYSLYADMPLWRQLENVAKNRWVGAYWQEHDKIVIPTISWGMSQTFEFCFQGVEKNAIVAVGMIGCKKARAAFMRGYNEMLNYICPEKVIVFGNPFPEMQGNLIAVDYQSSRKVVRYYGR